MRDRANIPASGLIALAAAGSLLASAACSTRPSYPKVVTTYCAEIKGIRAVRSIGCKDDEIGGLANTRGPNTSIEYPH